MQYPLQTIQQLRPILIGFRKQAGMSQAAVAALLGVSQQSYAKIEANPASTNVARLVTILKLLDVEIVLTPLASGAGSQASPAERKPPRPPARKTPRARASASPPSVSPPSGKKESW